MSLPKRPRWRLFGYKLPTRVPALVSSVIKATTALCIMLSLILIKPWARLNAHPTTFSGSILVVVAGYPGKTMGGCTENMLLGMLGLSSGVIAFVCLAPLVQQPVAQEFVFAFYVYLAALVRASGPKYISFYLYGILFAFNGIYTPIVAGDRLDWSWLLATVEAYLWPIAVVLAVNLLIWPISAEEELRKLTRSSLTNIGTAAHLLCKTFAREIEEDEIEVRDLLLNTIRQDYLAMTARHEEMTFEIVYSSFTLQDWRHIIDRVRGLQEALLTSSSALELIDALDPKGLAQRHLLSQVDSFSAFRNAIDLVIATIVEEITPGLHKHHEPDHSTLTNLPPAPTTNVHPPPDVKGDKSVSPPAKRRTTRETIQKVTNVTERLRREVERSEQRQANSRAQSRAPSLREGKSTPPSLHRGRSGGPSNDPFGAEASASVNEANLEKDLESGLTGPRRSKNESKEMDREQPASSQSDPIAYFRRTWTDFAGAQADALVQLIRDGALNVDDELRIDRGLPSLQAMYSSRLPKTWTSSLIATTSLNHRRTSASATDRPVANGRTDSTNSDSTQLGDDEDAVPTSEALTKSYSLLFGLGQLTDELIGLHSIVSRHRPKRLRPYIAFTLVELVSGLRWWKPQDQMSLQEALALLRGEEYKAPKMTLLKRSIKFEKWLRSDRSTYALKVALGAVVHAVFLLAPELQDSVFLRFGMTSSLITVIVGISPTLGAGFSTWALQLGGTGVGSLYGLIVLEIFQDVGGYRYNPYGLVAAFSIWCAFASVIFYRYPKYYTGGLLLVTGCGSNLVLEYVYNELDPLERVSPNYDSPSRRFAYTLASMAISIAISAFFQLLVLRTPAKQQLRLKIAAITFALSSYNTLLQSNVNLVAPFDEAPAPRPEALAKVQRELIKRESRIQSMILTLGPVYEFARVEPTFGTVFKGEVLLKIIRSHQIILDRLREARTAVGEHGFGDRIHQDFASALFPYRLHSQRLSRTLFYLAATSLTSKTQLARDVPSSKPTWASFEHDALWLSRRLSQLPRGEVELRNHSFLRYFFYIVSLASVASELERLEEYLGELFGSPEDNAAVF